MKSFIRVAALQILLLMSAMAHGQIIVNYPASAQDLTRGYGQGILTVQLGFTAACTGTTVTVALPASVTYVAGSVAKTAGSIAGSSIAESNISNLNAPVFAVSGITAAGDITFTVARQAGCGSTAAAKDTIKVSGSCGSTIENGSNTNTYNLFFPALSLTPPVAVTNAFIGSTYTRSLSITNGGNGCTDTLRFYIVYPAGGIVNTASNAITANSVSFLPSSTNGDTLFYKIFGAAIFGGDNLLCNGETVTVTEPIKVVKCAVTTSFGAGWGKAQGTQCQTATGTGSITMATGVPNMTVVSSDNTPEGACTPGISKVVYTNNGTGGNAGAIYNITATIGMTNGTTAYYVSSDAGQKIDNFSINGVPGTGASVTYTSSVASAPLSVNMNQFTTDPDGAGTGLEDLDGDGQYDDLAPGKSFTIYLNRIYVPDTVTCPRKNYGADALASSLSYTTMCGTANSTPMLNSQGGNFYILCCQTSSSIAPPQVTGGTPFNISFAISQAYQPLGLKPTDSIEAVITLPAGVTYAGNATYRGSAASTVTVSGNILRIKVKGPGAAVGALYGLAMDFGTDLVYDCSAGSSLSIPYIVSYIADRACGAIDKLKCGVITITALCAGSCADGMSNLSATVKRQSLGWTDNTQTVKVNPATLPALSLQTLTVFDTVMISTSAKEGATPHGELFFYTQFDKAASADILNYLSGTFHYKASGSSTIITLPVSVSPSVAGSTAALSTWTWNLTTMLGTGGVPSVLNAGDSIWVDMLYKVTAANNYALLGTTPLPAPNALAYFYNLTGGNPVFCGAPVPPVYFIGISRNSPGLNFASNSGVLSGCANVQLFLNQVFAHSAPVQPFPNEYRPKAYVDSVIVTLPAGVVYDNTTTAQYFYSAYPNKYSVGGTVINIAAPVIRGNQIIFMNDGTWKMSDFTALGNDMRIYFYVKSDCRVGSVTGPLTVQYQYFGKDFMYDAPGSVVPSINTLYTNSTALSVNGGSRPSITAQNNTGAVQGISPQHYWDVQINNTSTVTAPYIWVALEKGSGSGGISIDSVVLKPSNAVLAPASYNTTDRWYQISTAGLTTGAVQQARVYFKYSSCTADSILFKAGWNCTGYPSPDPLTGYACTAAQAYLKVVPQPSQVQLSVTRQPGNGSSISLCTTDSVLVTVNSAQGGNLLAPYVNVFPPAGVSLQLPVQIEYPLGSGSYQNATSTAIAGGYKVDLTSHTGIGAAGLPGTILNPATAGRQAKLKVMYNTSCGITSGSPLTFQSYGTQPCGAAAVGSGSTVLTGGINITGATTAGSAGVTVGIGSTSLLCGASATLNLSTTPVITPTQAGDTVIYTIPAGLAYAGNFTGTGFGTVTSTPGAGGTTLVKVPLPAGVAAGTAIPYGFDVVASGIGGCGNTGITALAKRDIAPLMCGGTACTGSSVVIGTGASSTITLSKPSLSTGAFNYTEGITTGSPIRTVNYTFSITNTGTANAAAGAYIIKILCGNAAGKVLSTFTNNAVAAGSLITQAGSFIYTIPADCPYGSPLFLQIQDTTAGGTKVCLCASPAGSTSAQVVPVKLSSFTGLARNCNAALSWRTEEEINFNYFDVEQGTDNIHYTKIATIAAHGTSTYAGLYSQPQGTAYYRLKMVDNDGRITYSDVVPVRTSCTGTVIEVYPNPVKDVVTVTGLAKKSQIRLMDVAGRMLTSVIAASATQQLNISTLAAGTYLLQVVQDEQIIQTIKLIKK